MEIGVFYFPVDYGINIVELAAALEERGFESLFVPEHTHIPVSRKSPFPGGGELPKRYAHTHDPFVALSFAAAATKKLRARHRHLPHPRARSDRHRQMRRQPRPALGRPGHLRDRRRLERRGDGKPRRPLQHPLQADARAHPRDEGAVDRGGGRVSRRRWSISTRCGPIPSRRRSRTRRSSWAARPITRCGASSNIATAGFRARAAASRSRRSSTACTGWRERLGVTRARCPPRCSVPRPTRRRSQEYAEAGIDRAVLEIPDREPRRDPARPRRLRAAPRLSLPIAAAVVRPSRRPLRGLLRMRQVFRDLTYKSASS